MAEPKKPTAKRTSVGDLFWNRVSLDSKDITDEQVAYFRQNPDQIDEVSSPLNLHRLFLAIGLVLGVTLIGASKALAYSGMLDFAPEGVSAFIIDVVFEAGAGLLGAAIVTFMLGVVLNQQQAKARAWRIEMRRRVQAD